LARPTESLASKQHPLTPSIRFLNGEIHDWYRMVLGYPDHLVASLFGRLSVDRSSRVLDPFCGSGTTLVECMKRGVPSAGIDANPVAVYASTAKTTWNVNSIRLRTIADEILGVAELDYRQHTYTTDLTFRYLQDSGMLDRGWICPKPLKKALAIKRSIAKHRCTDKYKRVLRLCLLSEVVRHASNVKFGPEIYCAKKKWDVAVFGGFRKRVNQVAEDLDIVESLPVADAIVIEGDSRKSSTLLPRRKFTHCVCSPPYPTEHDYTRNSRLELAFLERVSDVESLRTIKKGMIRSHTKCIYKGDRDGDSVSTHGKINVLVRRLRRAVGDAHGFVGLYPDVVAHYFGGMKQHFSDLKKILASGARCAYVVGDQSSYRGIQIPTAEILAEILETLDFRDIEIVHWRGRWSSARSHVVNENVLLFSGPNEH
jgi:hypothetical protein